MIGEHARPRAWPGAPRARPPACPTPNRSRSLSLRPGFSARARKMVPGAGAPPNSHHQTIGWFMGRTGVTPYNCQLAQRLTKHVGCFFHPPSSILVLFIWPCLFVSQISSKITLANLHRMAVVLPLPPLDVRCWALDVGCFPSSILHPPPSPYFPAPVHFPFPSSRYRTPFSSVKFRY